MTLSTFHLTSTAIARRSMAYAFGALAARQAKAWMVATDSIQPEWLA